MTRSRGAPSTARLVSYAAQHAKAITPDARRPVDWTMVLPNTKVSTDTIVQWLRIRSSKTIGLRHTEAPPRGVHPQLFTPPWRSSPARRPWKEIDHGNKSATQAAA